MDPTARRLAAIGLAATIVAAVYTVTDGWVQGVVSLAVVVACLVWGFRPGRASGGVTTFNAQVTKAEFRKENLAGVGTLHLTLLIQVHNDTDNAVTVRPTAPKLIRVTPWRQARDVPVKIVPEMAIDPIGRMADYSHFPEGQHTVPARSEQSYYFFFKAAVGDAEKKLQEGSLRLRLTVCLPGPHRREALLPPITFLRTKPPAGPLPSKASEQAPP